MLGTEIIIQRLFQVAGKQQARHPHYERVVKQADYWRRLVTGEGIEELLRPFARRESGEAFEQRKAFTKSIAPAVLGNIRIEFEKVHRARYARNLFYTNENGESAKMAELETMLAQFWRHGNADDYCRQRLVPRNFIDPNGWTVVTFDPFDNRQTRARPYPVELSSASVLDFGYFQQELAWLIAAGQTMFPNLDGGAPVVGEAYTVYLPDFSITLIEVHERTPTGGAIVPDYEKQSDPSAIGRPVQLSETPAGLFVRLRNKLFRFDYGTAHNAGRIPAMRVGYMPDLATDGDTFVPPYHDGLPYLEKVLKLDSETDFVRGTMTFPLVIRYADPCDAPDCLGGRVADGAACGTCHGTGTKKTKPTSAIEELLVDTPRSAADFINLENLLVYKAPPVELLQHMEATVERLAEQVKRAIFNAEKIEKTQVSATATERRIQLQDKYDALYKYAMLLAGKWKFIVTLSADFADLGDGLFAEIRFKKDFKFESADEMMDKLKKAMDSGASPGIKTFLQEDIARTVFADEPEQLARYLVRERLLPFRGMDDNETLYMLASDLVPTADKVLYANSARIFDEIEQESAPGNFYEFPTAVQRAFVDKKVVALLERIKSETRPVLSPRLSGSPEE